ncbi:hypothetical protein GCM10023144_28040 [Pigmentiphaga soli]|uniref:Diguanylate cyclase n=1 Tax=Pigmentiphaga soli TaxID=1007095 RepID=A0ABP8H6S6_9BURK
MPFLLATPTAEEPRELLRALELLDAQPDPMFDLVARMAAHALGVPIVLVTLRDGDRLWLKSRIGLDLADIPLDVAFCRHCIESDSPLVLADARDDPRFADHPMVRGIPGIRFYASFPLHSIGGLVLGTLSAIDTVPRRATQRELDFLDDAARLLRHDLRRREEALRIRLSHERSFADGLDSETRLRSVFEGAAMGIALVAPDGGWIDVNDALCEIIGYGADELHGLTFQDITHPDDLQADLAQLQRLAAGEIDRYALEKRYIRKDGGIVWANLTVTARRTAQGRLSYYISIVENIDARIQAQAALQALQQTLEQRVAQRTAELRQANARLEALTGEREREARQDVLTGLPNRRAFQEILPQALEQADRSGGTVHVLFIDLDGFKAINDTLGHAYGDLLLREVARRLTATLRPSDIIARLDGDEFVVIAGNEPGPDETDLLARRLLQAIAAPIRFDGREAAVSASIGIASYHPHDTTTPVELLRTADMGMYAAKRGGKNRYCFGPA